MNGTLELEAIFKLMKQTSMEIVELDLNNEESIILLEELQSRQILLRDQADLLQNNVLHNKVLPELNHLIQECLEWENNAVEHLKAYRLEISFHLQEINNASMAKKKYQSAYIQTGGYFVDRNQ